jgi:hypothetical protein
LYGVRLRPAAGPAGDAFELNQLKINRKTKKKNMVFIDSSTDPTVPVFYNVVHAVGKQCPNVRDDVKTVQYLLLAFYDKAYSSSSVYTRPKDEMKFDGACSPVTLNWILKFQLDVNTRCPGRLAADNRVDRVRNKNFQGSITGLAYTLGIPNKFVQKINPEAYLPPLSVPLENSVGVAAPSRDVVRKASTAGGGN